MFEHIELLNLHNKYCSNYSKYDEKADFSLLYFAFLILN